jgi:hypothetical protein
MQVTILYDLHKSKISLFNIQKCAVISSSLDPTPVVIKKCKIHHYNILGRGCPKKPTLKLKPKVKIVKFVQAPRQWINGRMKLYIHTVLNSVLKVYGRLHDPAALPR